MRPPRSEIRKSHTRDGAKTSRRGFLGGATVALAALGPVRRAWAVPAFRAYHDVGQAQHDAHRVQNEADGYRPLSVSIYGTPSVPLYAAVWVQRSGPTWRLASGVDAAGFQTFFNQCVTDGFRIVHFSATGPASGPCFVAIAEASTIGTPFTRHLLGRGNDTDDTTIDYWLKWARDNGQIPRALAIYGSDADPRYAIALEPNTANTTWNVGGLNEPAGEYQARFDAQVKNYGRATLVQVSPTGRYLSLFRGDHLVGGLVARHDMTSAGYQAEFDHWVAQGLYPIFVSAGGSGSGTRFSALFAQDEQVIARTWRRQGPDRSAKVDEVMTAIMERDEVRHATLAVVKDRKLLFARAYTYAEPTYPLATPTSHFRLASCSKTLAAILVVRLIQEGKLTLDTKVQSVLGIKTPTNGAPKDSRWANMTVRQLLNHTSGLASWYGARDVAAAFNIDLPVSKAQTASFVANQMLPFTPGTFNYSNFGYVLLGMLAEKLLSVSFVQALKDKVFTPLGINRVRVFPSLKEAQPADEAVYDSTRLDVGMTQVSAGNGTLPVVYGADFDPGPWDAGGALSVAAPDYAKIVASLNVRAGNPVLDASFIDLLVDNRFGFDAGTVSPRKVWKGGAIMGTASTVHFMENDISYVVCFAKDNVSGNFYPDWSDLRTAVAATTWPTADLFPTFGIPSFPALLPAWRVGTNYAIGAKVSHLGFEYRCRQAHKAQVGWEPSNSYALWERINAGMTWALQVIYKVGNEVVYNGRRYRARQEHQAVPGYEPTRVPTLWLAL